MTTAAAFGARAALVPCSPMINLTAIADRLADHLTGPLNAPLIQVQGDRIVIDPIPTLRALCVGLGEKPIDFLETDLEAFSKIVVRKVGAGIGNDRNAAATAVERIRNILRPQIDAALASDSARPAVDAALSFFAGSTKGKHFLERTPEIASIVPATFGDNASSAIGKTLLAIERVTATDWKSRIIQALEGAAAQDRNRTADDIIGVSSRARLDTSGQLGRFLVFLEDVALSRARLHVAMQILGDIAQLDKANPKELTPFQTYAMRIAAARVALALDPQQPTKLDPSSLYGANSVGDLSVSLSSASFYGNLPIWFEPEAQLYEQRFDGGLSADRAISYRLRVNGWQTLAFNALTAFQARVEKLAAILDPNKDSLSDPDKQYQRGRCLEVLVALILTLRSGPPQNLPSEAAEIAAQIAADPYRAIKDLLAELRSLVPVVEKMSDDLVGTIRKRPHLLPEGRKSKELPVTVSVLKSILKNTAFVQETDFLRSDPGRRDDATWLDHILTSSGNIVHPGVFLSFQVRYRLSEWTLSKSAEPIATTLKRKFDEPLVPIRLTICESRPEGHGPFQPETFTPFAAGGGIDILYLDGLFSADDIDAKPKSDTGRRFPVQLAATALLLEVALAEILRSLQARSALPLNALLLRSQAVAKSNAADIAYAFSQALERALGHIAPIKLQGLNLQETSSPGISGTAEWRHSQSLGSALTILPLSYSLSAASPNVALIAYATRPADDDTSLLLMRVYETRKINEPDVRELRLSNCTTHLIGDGDLKGASDALFDAIGKLEAKGFQHILLLSHDYGGRRRARAAERHTPHSSAAFHAVAAARHPSVCFYPLRRDIFPIVRFRTRDKRSESAFEITNFEAHAPLAAALRSSAARALLPIYSLATMSIVGGERRRIHSGVCTYFYDTSDADSQPITAEYARQNALGIGQGTHADVHAAIVGILRAMHFFENEAPNIGQKTNTLLPVLDPFDWATPLKTLTFGDVPLKISRTKKATFSLTAYLAAIANILERPAAVP